MQHNFKNKQLKTKNLTEKVSAAITLYNTSYLHLHALSDVQSLTYYTYEI